MENHLQKCVFNPSAADKIILESLSSKSCGPRQTILAIKNNTNGQQLKTSQQISDWEHDILRLFIAMEAKFNSANHPQVNKFFTKYFGRTNPSAWVLSTRLLKEKVSTLDIQMENNIKERQGTLVMDGWSSKKQKHLAAAVLLVDGKPYSTIVHDNSGIKKDGCLAFNQLSDKIEQLETTYRVTVIGVTTDNGADQV